MKKEKNPKKVGIRNIIIWNSRDISQGIGLTVVGYLTLYCTDTLNLPPALVGILLVVSRLLDGVTDAFAGFIVDRTDTKWGRGRPYEWCIIGMWLCIWLMFSCPPALSMAVKIVWVLLMYALVNSVFYTFLQASKVVYMCRAFRYQEQYVTLSSSGAVLSMIFVAVFNIAAPSLVEKLGTTASGWSFLMACLAIPMALIGILRFFFIKETVDVDSETKNAAETEHQDKVSLKDVKQVFTSNPYIWIIALTNLVASFVTNMGANTYYFKYVVGDLSMLSIINAVQLLGIPLMIAVPAILKKISVAKLIFIGCAMGAVGYGINYIAIDNTLLLSIASVFIGLAGVPISMLMNLMIIECADYNEWKGNRRMEGTLSSVTSVTAKVGTAAGAGVLGVLLSATGYVGDAALIPDSAMTAIRYAYSIIPAVLWILAAVSLVFYKKLDSILPGIHKELDARHGQKSEETVENKA